MNIEVTRINEAVESDPAAFVKQVNSEYQFKLHKITESIIQNRSTRPVILLSGPSGSGKTTTALMIEKILDEAGCECHTISMDNYFAPLSAQEKLMAAEGKMDLESPLRIDSELLNKQIAAISECREVEIPKYNFADSIREHSGNFLRRKKDELVIFEGIHALNPEVIILYGSNLWHFMNIPVKQEDKSVKQIFWRYAFQ